jgi:hypothetical protein
MRRKSTMRQKMTVRAARAVGFSAVTIAACFLTSEGVVLGADSTVTLPVGQDARYFNNEQKVFEIGERSSLGLTLWGSVPVSVSYRTLLAMFADEFVAEGESQFRCMGGFVMGSLRLVENA